ncbi:MAG: ATP-binding protein [Opitutaceae bacterium]|nr:ATP-binding protein [Opitutaceae bacterium]
MNGQRQLFAILWALLVVLVLMLSAFLWVFYKSGPLALVAAARQTAMEASRGIEVEYVRIVGQTPAPDSGLLVIVVESVLSEMPGVEGGIWHPRDGFVAYAFPTHEGAARKQTVPEAELPTLRALVERVDAATPSREEVRQGRQDALVLSACRLPGGLVAWTMIRVHVAHAQMIQRFTQGGVVALVLVVGAGILLLTRMKRWSRNLHRLEQALAQRTDPAQTLPELGETDLNRLVESFNASARQVGALSHESARLAGELARAERLAAIGRLAAALVHEIKNPLGAMRLRVENALAQEASLTANARSKSALEAVQRLIARLDRLVVSLLALTQPLRIKESGVTIGTWLRQCVEDRQPMAAFRNITLGTDLDPEMESRRLRFDPEALGRALDNLVHNALQHTPEGGRVVVSAKLHLGKLLILVDDSGPGVPVELQSKLLEPFVTGRSEGTGLGLAIAREIALAHGGMLRLAASPLTNGGGARFELEVPWREC